MQVLSKLEELSQRFEELNGELTKPEVISDHSKVKKLAREQSELTDIIKAYRALTDTMGEIEEMELIIQEESDEELVTMARDDLPQLKTRQEELEQQLNLLLIPDITERRRWFQGSCCLGTGAWSVFSSQI